MWLPEVRSTVVRGSRLARERGDGADRHQVERRRRLANGIPGGLVDRPGFPSPSQLRYGQYLQHVHHGEAEPFNMATREVLRTARYHRVRAAAVVRPTHPGEVAVHSVRLHLFFLIGAPGCGSGADQHAVERHSVETRRRPGGTGPAAQRRPPRVRRPGQPLSRVTKARPDERSFSLPADRRPGTNPRTQLACGWRHADATRGPRT